MTPLEEAVAVVKDRQQKYGPPGQHWELTVRLINSYFGTIFKPEDWALCMILDKLAREKHSARRDNMVDVAGYANGRAVVLDGLADRFEETHCKCGKAYRYVWDDESPTSTSNMSRYIGISKRNDKDYPYESYYHGKCVTESIKRRELLKSQSNKEE